MSDGRFWARCLPLLLSCLLHASCAGVLPQPPEVQLQSLQMGTLSLSHANLNAELALFNPNDFTVRIEQLSVSLDLNAIQIAHGNARQTLAIPPGQTGILPLNLSSAFFNLMRLTQQLQPGKELHYRLKGEVALSGPGGRSAHYPLSNQGTLPPLDDWWQPR